MITRINYSYNTYTPRFKGVSSELKAKRKEIVECLTDSSNNPAMQGILTRFSDLSAFDDIAENQSSATREGDEFRKDKNLQNGFWKLINDGTITPNTLVISDTGHDIPILAELLESPLLNFNFAFRLPFSNKPNLERSIKQTNTWGSKIKQKQAAGANGLFLGLEAHRKDKINSTLLPTFDELQQLGTVKVVYLAEAEPNKCLSKSNTSELQDYFSDLEGKGLEVSYRGVDIRGANPKNQYFLSTPRIKVLEKKPPRFIKPRKSKLKTIIKNSS